LKTFEEQHKHLDKGLGAWMFDASTTLYNTLPIC